MAASATMNSADGISGKLGDCYVTIDSQRKKLIQLKKVELKFEKSKTKMKILGKTGDGNRSTGWSGTGTATLYYNTDLFRELIYAYKETGKDTYFEMQISNDDPTSAAGQKITIAKNCNIDGGILATLDAEAEVLEEEITFTFDDFEFPTKFVALSGM